jgi:foldase protein PrsA
MINNKNNNFIYLNRALLCILFLAMFFLSGCDYFDKEKEEYVLSVGSRNVTVLELKKEMEFMTSGLEAPAKQWEMIRDKLVERIIDQYLILEYGKENGLSISDQELQKELDEIKKEYSEESFNEELLRGYVSRDEWEARLRDRLLVKKVMTRVLDSVVPPTYEEIKEYFEKNKDKFSFPEMVKFRQIVTKNEEEAKNLLDRIKNGEDMGQLAKQYSIAPEAEMEGVVGWLARENLHESMGDVIFSLSQGEVSKIVKTVYGYHIFQVLALRSEGVRELPEVKDEIESKILSEKQDAFFREWLKGVRSKYEININQSLLNQMEIY